MLANHDGPLFAARNLFWNAEPSPRRHILPRIDFHFVECDSFGFSDEAGARLEGKQGVVETPYGIGPKGLASLFECGLETVEVVGGVRLTCCNSSMEFGDGDAILAVVLEVSDGFTLAVCEGA